MTAVMNNHQAVLPPRMSDLIGWYDSERVSKNGTEVAETYDRRMRGTHLDETNAADYPNHGTLTGQFNGRRTIECDTQNLGIEEHQIIGECEVDDIFGTSKAGWTDQPKLTIAGVIAEAAESVGTETVFSLYGTAGTHHIKIGTHADGISFEVECSNGTLGDTADQYFTDDVAESFVFTIRAAINSAIHMWVGTNKLVWDTPAANVFALNHGTVEDIDNVRICDQWFGHYGEILIYEGAFDDDEVEELQRYLRDKWSCT